MPTDPRGALWVVGAGGLLGQAIAAAARRDGRTVHRARIPWADPDAACAALDQSVRQLLHQHDDLVVVWCAGAGVVATDASAFDAERRALQTVVEALAAETTTQRVRFFLASSAGGVYAGSAAPPFDERTAPAPLAPYGHAKLAAEELATSLAGHRVSVFIGRIANLYGPGQDLAKAQGLISQLCVAHLRRRPLTMYVSLDTARDHLYVDDAAQMVLRGLDLLADEPAGTVVTKILASHQPTTLASILGEVTRVAKRRLPIVLGAAPSAKFQARDLRFRSTVWTELDRLAATPLPAGIGATLADVNARLDDPAGAR